MRDVATIFKKIKLDTNENVGWGKIALPEESRHTTGYWLALGDGCRRGAWREASCRMGCGAWRTCCGTWRRSS